MSRTNEVKIRVFDMKSSELYMVIVNLKQRITAEVDKS